MSHHHAHSDPKSHDHGHQAASSRRAFHKDWRLWVAVGLMLIAMIVYVATLDEADVPQTRGEPAPIAAPAQ